MPRFARPLMMLLALVPGTAQAANGAQSPVDRADPSVVEEELTRAKPDPLDIKPVEKPVIGTETQGRSAIDRPLLVRSIIVEGALALPPEAFSAATTPYLGRTLDAAGLRALASDVAGAARAQGYGLATAWVPPQAVTDGQLRVTVDEGRIDEVEVDGDSAPAVRRLLLPLADGRPVRTADLERRVLLAGDLPGVSVGKARLDRIGGRNVLRLTARRDAVEGRAYLDNWGSDTIGPVRAQAYTDFNGLLAGDDRLSLGGVVTVFDPTEFGLARLTYAKGIGLSGTELRVGGYAARSRPGGELDDLDFEGQSLEGSVGLNHPLLRSRKASLWGDLEVSVRDSEQSLDDELIRNDRHAILKAGTFLNARLAGGRARARLAVSQGLDVLDATRRSDLLKSRQDGSAVFTKGEFWAHWDGPLAGPVSLQIEAEGQLASRPLLSSEEMGLGGRYFGRGYDYREFSGDKGIAGSVELRYDLAKEAPRPLSKVQLYVFADGGSVGNYRDGSGGGSLASAGGGLRARIGQRTDIGLELGVPLAEGEDGRKPDPRFSFTVGLRF
jgi:hemolysin activation/secretion protein